MQTAGNSRWQVLGLLFVAGCTLALHHGKVPAALPAIKSEFSLSLTAAGSIVATYSLLSALSAMLCGFVIARLGYARFAVVGIVLSGLGSLLGATSTGLWSLLFSRVLEGFGWVLAVLALPTIMSALCRDRDRSLVMGVWGAFVPIGAGSMLFLSPFILDLGGWRLSWVICGVVSLIAAVMVWVICRQQASRLTGLSTGVTRLPVAELKRPSVWLLTACFMVYAFQYSSVTALLPILLLETTTLDLATASWWVALVVLLNAVGNVSAGWLIRRGVSRSDILLFSAVVGGITANIAYFDGGSAATRIAAALGFSILGGLTPGTVFATVPVLASSPAVVGVLIGLAMQGTGIGQLVGPVALPAVVEASGGRWGYGGMMMLFMGLLGAFFAYLLGQRMSRLSLK